MIITVRGRWFLTLRQFYPFYLSGSHLLFWNMYASHYLWSVLVDDGFDIYPGLEGSQSLVSKGIICVCGNATLSLATYICGWFESIADRIPSDHITVTGGRRSQIAKSMGPIWGPPGTCRPQMGPMLAPWNLLSGVRSCVPDTSLEKKKVDYFKTKF